MDPGRTTISACPHTCPPRDVLRSARMQARWDLAWVHAALPYPQVPAEAPPARRIMTPRARLSPRKAPVRCKSCTANEREAEREGLPLIALSARRGCSPPLRPCEYRPTTRCGIRVRRTL